MLKLTPLEMEIFDLAGRGWTARMIAEREGCRRSESTIRTHLERVRKKLGLVRLAELVVFAAEFRLSGLRRRGRPETLVNYEFV